MKLPLLTRKNVRLFLCACMLGLAPELRAAVLTWDIAPGTIGLGNGTITGGAGTWDTTLGNWTTDGGSNNVAWPSSGLDNDAFFGDIGGVVTIAAGGVTANDLTFNVSGYSLTTNPLTLNGTTPTITATSGVSATINSNLSGSAGLIKSGDGTVVLGGTNSLTGGVTINQGALEISSAANLLASNGLTLSGGGALSISGAMTLANNVTIASGQSGVLKTTAPVNVTLSGNYTGMAGTLTLDMTANTGTAYRGFVPGSTNGPSGTVSVLGSSLVETQINLSNATYQNFFANSLVVANAPTKILYFAGANTATGMQYGALDGGNANVRIGFDNSPSARTVTINGVANGNFAGTIYNGTAATGAVSVIKNGASTQTLSGSNGFTGGLTINNGTVAASFATTANLGGGATPAVTVNNNGTLTLSGAAATNAAAITLAGGSTLNLFTTSGGSSVLSQAVQVNGSTTINLSHVGTNYANNSFILKSTTPVDVTINGGAGSSLGPGWGLTGAASGALATGSTLTFNGNSTVGSTYNAGNIYISSAVGRTALANTDVIIGNSPTTAGAMLALGNGGAGTVQFNSLSGGTSALTAVTSDNAATTIQINNGTVAGANFAGSISNGGGGGASIAIVKNGSGTQIFSGNNTYGGTTTINGGILQIGAVGNLPSTGLVLSGGGALNMTGTMTRANNVTIASGQSGTLKMVGATTGTLSGNYSGVAGTLTLDVSNGSGYSGFIIGSANGPALGSVVNILGTTNANNVQIGNSTLANQAFFANSKVTITATGSGNTYLAFGNGTATNAQFGALDGGNATTIIGFDNQTGRSVTLNGVTDANYSGQIFNGFAGSGLAVIKNGSAMQIFSGNNTYTGPTTVSGGKLLINGTNSGTGSTTVNAGATLGGTGLLASTVLVNTNGTLSPGASIESLSSGALTMNSGSTFFYEALDNSATGADLMKVNGALSLTDVILDLSATDLAAGTWTPGDKLTLISYTGSAITSGFAGYVDDTSYLFGSNNWVINYNDTVKGTNYSSEATGTAFVTLTVAAVPEPTTWAALTLSGFGLLMLRRKRS